MPNARDVYALRVGDAVNIQETHSGGEAVRQKEIVDVIMEARKLIGRAEAVLLESKGNDLLFITGNRTTGALRRQSMELTRALTRLRGTGGY